MDFSYQLYSARNEKSLDDTLKILKSLGYAQVEGWGGQFADPAALAASLKAAGLVMPTAHMGFSQLEDTAAALKIVDIVGIETVYCPAPPSADYREGKGDWQEFADKLGTIASAFKAAGKVLATTITIGNSSSCRAARRRSSCCSARPTCSGKWTSPGWSRPARIRSPGWTGWAAASARSTSRISPPAGEKADEDGWADVGHGTLDWKQLLADAKAKTKAQYFVMEHDKPSDAIRFARQSIESVKKWA